MKSRFKKHHRSGFTIVELLVVISIIALLFALTIGGFTYAQKSAARSRTSVALNAMKSGLERYHKEFGEYPAPQNPDDTISYGSKTYEVGGATMLYQALSGDGYDNIVIAQTSSNAGQASSNGSLDESESKNVMLTDMPSSIWAEQNGRYYMIDGFGRPFQYVKAVPTGSGRDPTTINKDYDLWSYGEDEENTTARSLDSQIPGKLKEASQKWIKNW
jgi:prepilin-type N-terminal cleavage/methylation domain-containing protein